MVGLPLEGPHQRGHPIAVLDVEVDFIAKGLYVLEESAVDMIIEKHLDDYDIANPGCHMKGCLFELVLRVHVAVVAQKQVDDGQTAVLTSDV